jgi:hypothetical protein
MAFLRRLSVALPILLCLCAFTRAYSQARFDLEGPKIDIRVTRGQVTLPIAAVPNLQPNDTLWLHPAFPPSQSVHYLLIVAFLRGTTNPPPDNWFTRIETWQKDVREEGVFITVPAEAQQAILFLAPETGGDFGTLKSAVKGKPGVFVRASQDLAEAGFEQARIEKYLEEIKKVPPGDPAALVEHSNLLARTLNLKPNPECFKRPADQQYTCLTQTGSQTLLDDGHGQSVVAALSNGPASDFINAASYTQIAGGGNFSPYVGAIVDLFRLTSSLHTAQYQYIPAIAFPADHGGSATPESNTGQTLNLRLNTPPSFHNPKSVIVIGLPAVQQSVLPPLRPADPAHISCLLDPHMVLPIEGAPLVFSTEFAHDLVLHLNLPAKPGQPASQFNLPVVADAYQGGLTLDSNPNQRKELPLALNDPDPITPTPAITEPPAGSKPAQSGVPGAPITGTIEGYWGFDRYTGPTLPLQNVPGQGWRIVTAHDSARDGGDTPDILIAGKPNQLAITSTGTACVESVTLEPGNTKLDWKLASPPPPPKTPVTAEAPPAPAPVIPKVEPIDLTLNLQHSTTPGNIRLAIEQFGEKEPDQLGTKTFAEPAKIESLHLHAGDLTAVLTGNSLDQVKDLTVEVDHKDLTFTPASATDTPDASRNKLLITLPPNAKAPNLKPNDSVEAQVHLQDGRTLNISTVVLPARPEVSLLSRRVNLPTPSPIQLASDQDLPLGAELTFFLKSREKFPRNETIEIMQVEPPSKDPADAADAPLKTTLSVAAGTLTLEDNHSILATFDPLKTFGPSTFGQFRFRAVAADGTPGEWIPLATIVRLPTLTDLHCPTGTGAASVAVAKQQPCQLTGSALYLIDSIAPDAAFANPVPVPEGFVDSTLSIPHPEVAAKVPASTPATFYIRLRDDPTVADAVTLPIEAEPRHPQPAVTPASLPAPPPPTTLTPAPTTPPAP